MTLLFVRTLAFVLFTAGFGACDDGRQPIAASSAPDDLVTVGQLLATPERFAGQRVAVRATIVAREEHSAAPCNTVTGEGCTGVGRVTLHLSDPDRHGDRVALYRRLSADRYAPVECKVLAAGSYDCGTFVPNSTTIVRGTFTRYLEPVQQVINPDGSVVVLRSRTIYFLVIA